MKGFVKGDRVSTLVGPGTVTELVKRGEEPNIVTKYRVDVDRRGNSFCFYAEELTRL